MPLSELTHEFHRSKPLRSIPNTGPDHDHEALLLARYAAEQLQNGPCRLPLHKVWAAYEPNGMLPVVMPGYYLVLTHRKRLFYRHFGLIEVVRAHLHFKRLADSFFNAHVRG